MNKAGDSLPPNGPETELVLDDVKTLHSLGYAQELLRRMSGFSNFAMSLSIICILAGGITSFHVGFCSIGGAAIGVVWPLGALLSLAFAATMGQLASAFPTAGGLYHWAAILGGRGWGWATAWLNLAGLVTVLAAINVGTFLFIAKAFAPYLGSNFGDMQLAGVIVITASQAVINHFGIKATTRLTDFSGYLILAVATALAVSLLAYASGFDPKRLITFTNYSGPTEDDVWPPCNSLLWLFGLSFLLPAYTITGFDGSAHTSEETIDAAHQVPRAMIRAVLVSALFGWFMLSAIVLAMPNMDQAAAAGDNVFFQTVGKVLPNWLALPIFIGIAVAQYLCGLATVTSTSRVAYAFARDGGMPMSRWVGRVSRRFRTPAVAIWTVCVLSVGFALYTPVYTTITTVCVIFLYLSYVIPIAFGILFLGRSWTRLGPWTLGRWYRPLATVSVLGCAFLILMGVQPPNDKALWIILASFAVLITLWFGYERRAFAGPPQGVMDQGRQAKILAAEKAVGEESGVILMNREQK